MKIEIPSDVKDIMHKLDKSGFSSYLAGGCVRDSIIGKIPEDFDITTDATPSQIEEVFKDYLTLDVGKKYGTIIVVLKRRQVEITTFRADGTYSDGRKPDAVVFSKTVEEDVSRRDFTFNAMVYNDSSGLIDLYDGIGDLNKRRVRTVGIASERFNEDYLRILRCIRFATILNFDIEEETYNAVIENAYKLEKISCERIREEFIKILISNFPDRGLDLLIETKLYQNIIPKLEDVYSDTKKFEELKYILKNSERDKLLRLAILFKYLGSIDDLKNICGTNEEKDILSSVINFKEVNNPSLTDVKRLMKDIKDKNLEYIIKVGLSIDSNNDNYIGLKKHREYVILKNEPYKISDLKINGFELKNFGIAQGPDIGRVLSELIDYVIENPSKNNISDLKTYIKNNLGVEYNG